MTRHPMHRLAWLLLAALCAGLLVGFAIFLVQVWRGLSFRYEIDYGEGIVWQQALLIPGPRMYGDITRFPFIVFHYPPLYHLAARAVAGLGMDGLLAGRLVSLGATGVMLAAMASLAWGTMAGRLGRVAAMTAAFVAVFLPLALSPIFEWAFLMRVDMLAMALAYLGMLLAVYAPTNRFMPSVGALLFVAAIYTKQTAIAAPAAAFGVLFLAAPMQAVRAALPAAVVAVAALLTMTYLTEGGFLRHIVGYNINRFDLVEGLSLSVRFAAGNAGLVFVALAGGMAEAMDRFRGGSLIDQLRRSRHARFSAVLILHALLTTAMLPMIGKSGASINYLIEWSCALALLASVMIGRTAAALRALTPTARPHLVALVLPAMLLLQIAKAQPEPMKKDFFAARTDGLLRVEAELRADGRPALSDDMTVLIRAGSGVVWEPAIFAELASLGRWDEAPLLAMLERRDFAMVITEGRPGTLPYDSRYSPRISDAILRNYPRAEMINILVVRRARE